MTIFKRFLVFATILAALSALWGHAMAGSMTVYVAADQASVYNIEGTAIGSLSKGTALELTGVKNGVCRVTLKGRTGYMFKSDLAQSAPASADEAVKTGNVTVYAAVDGAKAYDAKGRVIGNVPLNTEMTCTAVKGDICRVEARGRTAYMRKADLSAHRTEAEPEPEPEPVRTAEIAPETAENGVAPAHGTAREMDWWDSDIQTIFAKGVTATITDVATGLAWREQRRGGTNHADVQPLTAADTAVLKQVYGGTWSWTRRAIFVTIDGVNYAASMNGMPHGGSSIADNNFNGHHCIHFTNSRTHGSNSVCALHQAAIRTALAAKL